MSDHQADYPIATMCRVLGVSSSGYHAWVKRRPSQRAETDAVLIAAIRAAHTASRGPYGAPRVHAELAAKGIRVGCKRVARLMTQAGLAGVCRRRLVTTTVKDGGRQAPDLVERNFTAQVLFGVEKGPRFGVRPCGWTESSGSFDRLRGVLILELYRAEIAQGRMQAC